MATEKPSSGNKIQARFKSRRMSHQSAHASERPIRASQKNKKLKIKACNMKRSTSRSKSSQRRGSITKKSEKMESLIKKLKRKSTNKSPLIVKSLRKKSKGSMNQSQIITLKLKKSRPKRVSPSKSSTRPLISRNSKKNYHNSQIISPNVSENKSGGSKVSPKKVAKKSKNNMSFSQTQRSMFMTKKSQKSGKSASKNNQITMSPQQTLLDMILNSTGNPMSFAKDIDISYGKNLFVNGPTKTAGTTKGTMSPQSTNMMGTKFLKTNKYLEDFKLTLSEACKTYGKEKEKSYSKHEKAKILKRMVQLCQKTAENK